MTLNPDAGDRAAPAPFVGSDFPEEIFRDICALLRQKRQFDLGVYKDRCAKRRVAMRVRARGLAEAGPYLELLRREPAELDALLGALTVSVSQFFRNASTFLALERRILPELLRRARQADCPELRLWSVGCAGGEEPYSLALLLDELNFEAPRCAILGSDFSDQALAQAREGLYDAQRLSEVPEAVRTRYFAQEGTRWRLAETIRQRVRFRKQDILSEEPYPAADLILCRNVLIYFSRTEQERILERFAEALSPDGFLILGRAETLMGPARRRFAIEIPEERVYRRRRDRTPSGVSPA